MADHLKPGGYMMIGLYSEYARQNVVAGRKFVEDNNFPATIEGIRACRQKLLQIEDDALLKICCEI